MNGFLSFCMSAQRARRCSSWDVRVVDAPVTAFVDVDVVDIVEDSVAALVVLVVVVCC